MPPLRTLTRRALVALAGAGVLGGTFTAGVVAGAGSSPRPAQGVLDDAAAQIAASALTPVDRATLDAAAVDGMLAAASDPWGALSGTGTAGVGLWLRRGSGGTVVVDRVSPASPAQDAGLRPGDQVRGVGDTSVRALPPARVATLLRGPAGSEVRLTVARGALLRTLSLRRRAVQDTPVQVSEQQQVTRVTVAAFDQGVGRQVRAADAQVRATGGRGLLLDLRGNPGGRLDEAVETASTFLSGGPVTAYERRGAGPQRLDAVGTGDTSTPLVVLVDGGTASAAEVVAAALQDRGRAVLVGSRTFGKGTVQEPRPLPDGSALELTVARWTTPSGRSVDGTGLVPDIEVAPGQSPDVAVRRATEVLTGLRAGAGGRG